MSPTDRWMALDVGHKRIGVALSDPLKLFARPLTCLLRQTLESDVESILSLAKTHDVSLVIIGLPRHLDGRPAEISKKIDPLAEAIQKQSSLTVKWCDERLSSKEAEELMAELQVPARERRKLRDAYAAAIILNRFLQEGATTR